MRQLISPERAKTPRSCRVRRSGYLSLGPSEPVSPYVCWEVMRQVLLQGCGLGSTNRPQGGTAEHPWENLHGGLRKWLTGTRVRSIALTRLSTKPALCRGGRPDRPVSSGSLPALPVPAVCVSTSPRCSQPKRLLCFQVSCPMQAHIPDVPTTEQSLCHTFQMCLLQNSRYVLPPHPLMKVLP